MPTKLKAPLEASSVRVLIDTLRTPSDHLRFRIHVYEEDRATGMAVGDAAVDGYTLNWYGPKKPIPEVVLIREIEAAMAAAVSQFLAGARNGDEASGAPTEDHGS